MVDSTGQRPPPSDEGSPTSVETPSPAGDSLAPNARVDGYEIIRKLGEGGMGIVYLARDVNLGRKAVLKVIKPSRLGTPTMRERFLFEARITARMTHPNIVTVYGLGEVGDAPYVALEFLDGQNLRERLEEGDLSTTDAVEIAVAVADALVAAHDRGILHRDLKPENVFISRDGRIRVLDFGLARLVLDASHAGTEEKAGHASTESITFKPFLSRDDTISGTAPYMAPEQWRQDRLTGAVDVWAAGVMLFEMLTGTRPFHGPALEMAREVMSPTPTPGLERLPEQESGPLLDLVRRCLDKDPAGRPSAAELVHVLRVERGVGADGVPRSGVEDNPFRGLFPFRKQDAGVFFGRDGEIAAFLEKLRAQPLLPIVGGSGAGKSSFAMAGVLARLEQRGDWIGYHLRPSTDPFGSLAACFFPPDWSTTTSPAQVPSSPLTPEVAAMFAGGGAVRFASDLRASPALLGRILRAEATARGKRLLLVVDQFEELYTLTGDGDTRAAFAEALCLASDDPDGPVRVVLTARDDFLSRLAEHRGLAAAMDAGVTVLRTPGPEALAEILRRPVELLEHRFEDDELVPEMVLEVVDEPSGLPLLQFAAQRMWEARDRSERVLMRSVYQEIGGVAGALVDHADRVLEELGPRQSALARSLLLRLVTVEGTRKQVTRQDLLDGLTTEAEQVLDKLLENRLVASRRFRLERTETSVELAHESLLARWKRLRRWVEESREDLEFQEQILAAASTWENRGRRDEHLWRGESLAEAIKWRERVVAPPVPKVTEFLDQCAVQELHLARRKRRLRRLALVGALLVAGLSIMAALYIAGKERQARTSEAQAVASAQEARAAQSESRRSLAQAPLSDARAAHRRQALPEARAKLRRSLELDDSAGGRALWMRMDREPLYFSTSTGWPQYEAEFSPSGDVLATSGPEGVIRLWDVETGDVGYLREAGKENWQVSFDPAGQRLATGDLDGNVHIWDLSQGSQIVFPAHSGYIKDLRFSRSGEILVTAGADFRVRGWDLESWNPVWRLDLSAEAYRLDLSSDGSRLAVAGRDGFVLVVDTATGQGPVRWAAHPEEMRELRWLDEERLACLSKDGFLKIWRIGKPDAVFTAEHRIPGGLMALSPERNELAVAAGLGNQHVSVWDLTSGEKRGTFPEPCLHCRLDWHPEGDLIAAAAFDTWIHVWRRSRMRREETSSHDQPVTGLSFSPDGKRLASGAWDRRVLLWDLESGQSISLEGHSGAVREVLFSPNGELLATAANDHTIRIWDARADRGLRVLGGHDDMVWGLAFSKTGDKLVSGSYDATLRRWDPSSGRQHEIHRGAPGRHHFRGLDLVAGGHLAVAGTSAGIHLVDMATGDLVREFPLPRANRCSYLDVSPEGDQVASGTLDGGGVMLALPSGEPLLRIGEATPPFDGVAFSPDGTLLATASYDRYVRIWDARTGELLCRFTSAVAHNSSVAWNPDGRLVAAGSEEGAVTVWDLAERRWLWRAPLLLLDPTPRLVTGRGEGLQTMPKENGAAHGELTPEDLVPALRDPVRAVIDRAAVARVASSGRTMTFFTAEEVVEHWDLDTGRKLCTARLPGIEDILPVDAGFFSLATGAAAFHATPSRAGGECPSAVLVEAEARSLVEGQESVSIPAGDRIHRFSVDGERVDPLTGAPGLTTLLLIEGLMILGFSDGSIEVRTERRPSDGGSVVLDATPSGRVTIIRQVTDEVIVAGFGTGLVGLWNIRDGERLDAWKLHGPITHLEVHDERLYAVSAAGGYITQNLRDFYRPYCELIKEVWDSIPVTWDEERPIRRAPDPEHVCRSDGVEAEDSAWFRSEPEAAGPR